MPKREREGESSQDELRIVLTEDDATKLAIYMSKILEDRKDIHLSKRVKKSESGADNETSIMSTVTRLFRPITKSALDEVDSLLSEIVTDEMSKTTVKECFDGDAATEHSLEKWSYVVPFPKEFTKTLSKKLLEIRGVVKYTLDSNGKPNQLQLNVYFTEDKQLMSQYLEGEIKYQMSHGPTTVVGGKPRAAWTKKHFDGIRYSERYSSKVTYSSRIGNQQSCTFYVYVELPISSLQFSSYSSPLWLSDVSVVATDNPKEAFLSVTCE